MTDHAGYIQYTTQTCPACEVTELELLTEKEAHEVTRRELLAVAEDRDQAVRTAISLKDVKAQLDAEQNASNTLAVEADRLATELDEWRERAETAEAQNTAALAALTVLAEPLCNDTFRSRLISQALTTDEILYYVASVENNEHTALTALGTEPACAVERKPL